MLSNQHSLNSATHHIEFHASRIRKLIRELNNLLKTQANCVTMCSSLSAALNDFTNVQMTCSLNERKQFESTLNLLTSEVNKALTIAAKRIENKTYEQERTSLFASSSSARNRTNKFSSKKKVSNKRNVADSLTRTKRQMEQELSRVNDIAMAIEQDASSLHFISEEQKGLKSIMQNARGVLRQLSTQDMQEKAMIAVATLWFFSVALYCCWTRLPGFGLW